MDISGLEKRIARLPEYQAIVGALAQRHSIDAAILDQARPFFLSTVCLNSARLILVLTSTTDHARRLYEQLTLWLAERADVLLYPAIADMKLLDLWDLTCTIEQAVLELVPLDTVICLVVTAST